MNLNVLEPVDPLDHMRLETSYESNGHWYIVTNLSRLNPEINLSKFKSVFLFQDPLDLFIGNYFDAKDDHSFVGNNEFDWSAIDKSRRDDRIDDYVSNRLQSWRQAYYLDYLDLTERLGSKNVHFTSNALLNRNCEQWLVDVCKHICERSLDEQVLDPVLEALTPLISTIEYEKEIPDKLFQLFQREFQAVRDWLGSSLPEVKPTPKKEPAAPAPQTPEPPKPSRAVETQAESNPSSSRSRASSHRGRFNCNLLEGAKINA